MFRALEGRAGTLPGHTVLLVDVSGSMEAPISQRSEMRRSDAAYGVAILLREIAEKVTVYTFSNEAKLVPGRRGMALRDALDQSQAHGATYLGKAIAKVEADMRKGYNRMVVITDEQSHDQVPAPHGRGYVINVASNRNGVGYGAWMHVDGWSEAVVEFIVERETTDPAST
jgi:Mg-chelatase subunit ChlD